MVIHTQLESGKYTMTLLLRCKFETKQSTDRVLLNKVGTRPKELRVSGNV